MKRIVFVAVALAFLPGAAAQQTELGGKVRSGREVTIPAGQTVRGDLVASGGTVRIDGRVEGDLVTTGGQVTVAGTVTGDLLAAAGSTTISGQIEGDARVAVGQARVQRQGRVGEDLLIAVGQATVASGSQIGGDLIFATGRMQMDGAVTGSVLGTTGNYTEGGSIGGTERVNVQQPEGQQEPTLADRGSTSLRCQSSCKPELGAEPVELGLVVQLHHEAGIPKWIRRERHGHAHPSTVGARLGHKQLVRIIGCGNSDASPGG